MKYSMEWKIGEIKQINGEWYQSALSPLPVMVAGSTTKDVLPIDA